jgi:hypothetical protein
MTESFELVPAALAVQAMRDNGYRNAAYALAELVDNSVQAGAHNVELLCAERDVFVGERTSRNLTQVAVLDDGTGMSPDVLRIALQFGNGTRLDDRSGIGRFGMGLPSASISQCKRVDVWSWTDGVESAFHTYIDVDEIVVGDMTAVPQPESLKIPKIWRQASSQFATSGTLVVWSKIDRCMWKRGGAVIKNSEMIVGRMYRSFIQSEDVKIRMAAFDESTPKAPTEDRLAVPNDPGYLMPRSSTPSPFDNEPMFGIDGDATVVPIELEVSGEKHQVLVRYSVAKMEARSGDLAGATPHGKHAKKNVGVSVMRANRELNLDQGLVNPSDARERWWGVQIDFPPSLDELFGVSNNKQEARNFGEITKEVEGAIDAGLSVAGLRQELEESGDPRWALVDLVDSIYRRIRTLRNQLKVQKEGERSRKSVSRHDAERIATNATALLQGEGQIGRSDIGEANPPEQRAQELEDVLVDDGLDVADAHAIAVDAINFGIKYVLTKGEIDGSAFFTVRPVAGEIVVKLNIDHPAYEHLIEALDEGVDDLPDNPVQLKERLAKAGLGLRLLLLAWARFEDEQLGDRRTDVQDIRSDWGRYAKKFLATPE